MEEEKKVILTYILIVMCIVIFLGEFLMGNIYGGEALTEIIGKYGFSLGNLLEGRWWTPLTSIFLHGNPEHLFLNIIALFFFGRVVEKKLGWKSLLIIFLATGLVGELGILILTFLGLQSVAIVTIGASGAIFGLLGVATIVKPLKFMIYPYIIPIPLILVSALYVLYNIGGFLATIIAGEVSQVSYVSHIGGLAAGIVISSKIEGKKKSLQVALLLLVILIAIPFIWSFLEVLEIFNYLAIFG